MTSPDHTLWHPHTAHDVYDPLKGLIPVNDFERLAALADENQHAIEDIVNNPAYTFPFHVITPTTGLVSDRYYVPETVYLVKALCSLSTAGSSTSTIDVFRNGAAIAPVPVSLSLTSAVHTATQACRQVFTAEAGDYVTVKSTTVGTSAAGLVVLLLFQPIA